MQGSLTENLMLVVYYLLFLFYLFLIGRLVVEIVRSFARSWRPSGGAAVGLEMMYRVTDPPVNLLRRLIPSVRIGNISLDLSMLILLFAVFILQRVALAWTVRG